MDRYYEDLILQLSWDCPKEVQVNAMQKLISDQKLDCHILIMPWWRKDCWLNCAKILIEMGYLKNKDVLDGLFEWIQDMNWPGAKLVFDYLQTLPKEIFMYYYQRTIKKAIQQQEDTWLYYLTLFMKPLMLDSTDFSSEGLYVAMCKDY